MWRALFVWFKPNTIIKKEIRCPISADNGIYIASFPTEKDGSGYREYRVIHAQAIENCDYGDEREQDLYRLSYYGDAKVYETEAEAMEEAKRLYSECDICEYGICSLEFDRPLLKDRSSEQAEKELNAMWR